MKKSIFILLMLASASFSYAQVPNYVPSNGLVGWWPFNGNANDESGNGNNGTVNGATLTSDRFGNAGKAYGFNNNLITTNYFGISGGGSRTISLWIKTNSSSVMQPVTYGGIPNGNASSAGKAIQLSLNYGASGVNANTGYSAVTYQCPTPVNNNQWSHYIWVFDSIPNPTTQNIKIYQNGVLLTNVIYNFNPTATLNTYTVNCPLKFGNDCGGYDPFLGSLDDIGFWNRALTPQEITTLYQGCNLNVTANPSTANAAIGANTSLVASGGTTYQWQTNPANNGWQNVNNNSTYSGATTGSLGVNNVQLQNHQQQFRVISGSGNCVDTAYALINVTDTCINTTSISVTDTLIINAVLSGVNPPNNTNTLLVYPNPARTHITIDNGNFALMNGYTVRINSALGQTVFTQAMNQQQFFIDLSTWTGNGLYYLDLIDNQGNSIETKVIVVQ